MDIICFAKIKIKKLENNIKSRKRKRNLGNIRIGKLKYDVYQMFELSIYYKRMQLHEISYGNMKAEKSCR